MEDIRVLIIEDDPMVIEINSKVVQACPGFTVVASARSGATGIEAINKFKPNLVILDIFMPQKNGLEFLKEMRQKGLDMDIIMVTASQDPLHLKEGLRYGVIDYIIKPFRLERLNSSLSNYSQMVQKLSKKSLCQKDIDLIVKQDKSKSTDLPKGLSLYTLSTIKDFLKTRDDFLTADEIADHLGISRVTARRYLEYLIQVNEVESNLEYGTVGRPIKKYRRIVL